MSISLLTCCDRDALLGVLAGHPLEGLLDNSLRIVSRTSLIVDAALVLPRLAPFRETLSCIVETRCRGKARSRAGDDALRVRNHAFKILDLLSLGVRLCLNDLYAPLSAGLCLRVWSFAVSQSKESAACVIVGNAPRSQKAFAFFGGKRLLDTADDAAGDSQAVSL